ncbi:hypothetical protein [Niameybacter massiliensis]|uniref:hypothetical protein n=1 Tax=Niameybacter massiliensis TaxID=1658108 RepID=UPI0006B4BD7D|nr:hypothetical protein [Niameybacter massiliensis]
MKVDDIIRLINELPMIIIYVYPGFIVLQLYRMFTCKDDKICKYDIFKYITISSLIVLGINTINQLIIIIMQQFEKVLEFLRKFILLKEILFNIEIIILAIIIALIAYYFQKSNLLKAILKKLKVNISTHGNVISDIKEDGDTYLTVYLKDSKVAYQGYLYLHRMQPDEEQVIVLRKYSVIKLDESGMLEEEDAESFFNYNTRSIIFKYSEIKKIEVCYPKKEHAETIDNK